MKKIYSLILTFALLAMTWAGKAQQTLTVYDGTSSSGAFPADIYDFNHFTLSQFVIPSEDLAEMSGGAIKSITFYTSDHNISYTTTCNVDVYLKEVDYTSFGSVESKSSATIVYQGRLTISAGTLTITLNTPFAYHGGNLLVGTENTAIGDYQNIRFLGQYKSRASIYGVGSSSLSSATYHHENFIPKTTFEYIPPAAQTVEIGEGTFASYKLPVNMYYHYSLCQQIYTADEINMPDGGTIQTISFHYAYPDAFSLQNVQLFLKNTNKSGFTSNTDMEIVSTADRVFAGTFAATDSGWVTIYLDTPFEYNGRNLLVCMYDPTNGYPGSSYTFYRTSTTNYKAITYYSDTYTPDLENITTFSDYTERLNYRANIRLGIMPNQQSVAIGDGTGKQVSLPVNTFFNYSLNQQIYTAEDINIPDGGKINAISFYHDYYLPFTMNNVSMYLLNTDKRFFENDSDMVAISASNRVFHGTFSAAGRGWVTVTLDSPFDYDGRNLLICMYDSTSGHPSDYYHQFLYTPTWNHTSIAYYSDNKCPNLNNINPYFGFKNRFLSHSNILLDIVPASCPRPAPIAVNNITSSNAELSWTGSDNSYDVRCKRAYIFLNEDFEGGTMPSGWSSVSESGSSSWVIGVGDYSASTGAASGSGNAKITHSSNGNSTYLITPVMNLSGVSNATLNFWYINRKWGSDIDILSVYYRTNGGAWHLLFHTSNAHGTWTRVSIPLSGLSNNYQIGFKMNDHYGFGVGIDNVVVYEEKESQWHSVQDIANNTHTFTNLIPYTDYVWQVRGNCSVNNSEWSTLSTFHTGCDPYPLPYLYDFHDEAPFNCWSVILGDVRRDGSYLDLIFNDNSSVALPRFEQEISTLQLSFETTPSGGTFDVGYMTDLSDPASFVIVNTYSHDERNHILKTEYFDTAPNGAVMAFRHNANSSSSKWYVYNVTVRPAASCKVPNQLTASGITAHSALLNWAARGSETSWNLYYKKSSTANYTKKSNVTKPYTLSDLDANTEYDFYVEAVCGSNCSSPSESYQFLTECGILPIPYTYTFDDKKPFRCWSAFSSSANTDYRYLSLGSGRDTIALPPFEEEISNLEFSFRIRPAYADSSCGRLSIGYLTNPTAPSSFYAVHTYNATDWSSPEFVLKTEYFEGAPAGSVIAIKSNGGYYCDWFLDDVTVTWAPTCIAPNQLTTSNITDNEAVLDWNAHSGESSWNLYYKSDENAFYTKVSNVQKPYTLQGLASNTSYKFYVEAVCGTAGTSTTSELCSFTTECQEMLPIPYTCDFESENDLNCWSLLYGRWERDIYGYHNHTEGGHHSLDFYSYDINGVTALPKFEQAISNLQISFYISPYGHYNVTDGEDFSVGYITDLNDTSSFVAVTTYKYADWNIPSNKDLNYILKTEYFTNAPAGAQIAFRQNKNVAWYIDDIVVSEAPACKAPGSPTVTDITENSATVNWVKRGSETSWNLYYKKDTDADYTVIHNATKPYLLTGLDTLSTYEVYVEALCSSDAHTSSGLSVFTTLCAPFSIPYSNDFESGNSLKCWNSWNSRNSFSTSSSTNHTAEGHLCLIFDRGDGSRPATFVLPEFDHNISDLTIKFWTRPENHYNSDCGTLDVGYLTNPSDTSTFVTVNSYTYNDWTSDTFIEKQEGFLGAPAGSRIAFRKTQKNSSGPWFSAWFVDDLEVFIPTSCGLRPNNLAASGITSSSATLSWNANNGETTWNLYYKKSSDTAYTEMSGITSNSIAITGLTPSTVYKFYVEAVCSSTETSIPSAVFSFTTTCNNIGVPYTCDFENVKSYDCWHPVVGGDILSYSSNSSYGGSGNYLLYFSQTTSDLVALPTFNEPVANLKLTFRSRPYGTDCGTFSVGYITNLSNPSSFVPLSTYSSENWDSYYRTETNYFTGVPSNAHIAFRHNAASSDGKWMVDDVTVELATECRTPNQLTALNISSDAATLSWHKQGGETVWDLYYKKVSDETFTEIPNVGNPYYLSGLESSTKYEYYVKAVCSSTTSIPTGSYRFVTDCSPNQEVPYSYDFETQEPFNCWIPVHGTVDIYKSSYYNHTSDGQYSLQFTGNQPRIIAMPLFNGHPISELQISFLVQPSSWDISQCGTFSVGYMTNPSDASTFVPVSTYRYDDWNSYTYKQKTEYFTDAPAGAHIAFKQIGGGNPNYYNWYLDDVEVTVAPNCKAPKELTVNDITATTATLNWNAYGSVSSWNLYYKKASDESYTEISGITIKPYVLANLEPNTDYQFRVESVCGAGNTSDLSDTCAFTTSCNLFTEVPYSYDFEDEIPFRCWQTISGTTRLCGRYNSTPDYGKYYLCFDPGYPNIIALPEFNSEISNLKITFQITPSSDNQSSFSVGYVTDINDPSTFVAVNSYNVSEWEFREVFKQKTEHFFGAPNGARIAFRNNGYGRFYVENVVVDYTNGCPAPSGITVSGITSASATIDWTPRTDETSWNLYYKTGAASEYTLVPGVVTHPYTLTGLSSGTTYTCYVEAVCSSSDVSEPLGIVSFSTDCADMVAIPYAYDFENKQPFLCWTLLYGAAWLTYSCNHTEGGTFSMDMEGESEYGGFNSLIAMPQFEQEISNLTISFWLKPSSYSSYLASNDSFSIGYVTQLNDPSSFVPVNTYYFNEWSLSASTTAFKQKIEFFPDAPAGSHIAFLLKNGIHNWFLDDILVSEISTCMPPENLTATDITTSTANLSWTARNGETAWKLYYKTEDDAGYTMVDVDTSSYSLTGLTTNTHYECYVEALCGSGSSSPSNIIDFFTECGVLPLPYTYDFEDPKPFYCWYPICGSANFYNSSSENSLYLSSNGTTVIALPQFEQETNTLQIEFEAERDYGSSSFAVGYLTDLSDPSTFVAVRSYSSDEWGVYSYLKKTVSFSGTPAGTHIAFRLYAYNESLWFLDNVEVTALCLLPANLEVAIDPADLTTADLTWTGSDMSATWVVEYGTSEIFSGATTVTTTTTSCHLTGLTPGDIYYARVRSDCDIDGEFLWSNTVSFTLEDTAIIGSGTLTNTHLPSYSYYSYALSQQIYTPTEIGAAGSITRIDFFNDGDTKTRTYDMYLLHTNKGSFNNESDWVAAGADNLVFSGTVTMTAGEWTSFVLSSPFDYNGTDNLLLVMDDNTGSYTDPPHMECRVFDATGQALIVYEDNPNYNPANPNSYIGEILDVKNQIRVFKTAQADCISPHFLTVSEIGISQASLSWTEGGSATEWQICVNDDEANLITVTEPYYTLTGLTPGTDYTVKVRANCGGTSGTSHWSLTSFSTHVCTTPTFVTAKGYIDGTADVDWDGHSDSFTLKYRLAESSVWTTVANITGNSYYLTGLEPGDYQVAVFTDCSSGSWYSSTFTVSEILSTANWYGFANAAIYNESWEGRFISFTMQDPTTVTTSTDSLGIYFTYAAAYADGYVWCFRDSNGDLVRATLDNNNKTISTFETIISGFESDIVTSMSYNPSDGKIYYITNSNNTLKSFDPIELDTPTEIGTTSIIPQTFAINSTGNAYCINNFSGDLYQINLNDASTTLVGNTGLNVAYKQDMAFDMQTGELFWAQIYSGNFGLYKVNPATAETFFIGRIGGVSGLQLTSMFMGDNTVVTCPAPASLTVSDFGVNRAVLSWTETGSATEWQICVNGDETNLITVTENPYTLTGLTPGTDYTIKVRANCGGTDGVSCWMPVRFSTFACTAPTLVSAMGMVNGTADVSWDGHSASFTLEYRLSGSSDWTSVAGLDGNSHTLTGLSVGNYEVRVAADCDAMTWVSTTFSVMEVLSTANWYGYVAENYYGTIDSTMRRKYISFTMQNPLAITLATVSSIYPPYIYDATYADGQVWCIPTVHDLTNATLDNYNQTISDFYIVSSNFETTPVCAITYNPHDGNIYYITHTHILKYFNPAQPNIVTEVGTLSCDPSCLAINSAGIAYSLDGNTGNLYRVNLTDASYSLIGNTGQTGYPYSQGLTFDLETGELFWARCAYGDNDPKLYKMDTATAAISLLGYIGGEGVQIRGLIMVGTPCPAPSDLAANNITITSAELGWTENGSASTWTVEYATSNDFSNAISETVTATPSLALTGLTPETLYYVRVKADCGNSESDWSEVATFTTLPRIIPSYAEITGETEVCAGHTTLLTATTDVEATYLWNTGETTQVISVGVGDYSVTVTSTTGDELASDTVTVTEKQNYNVNDYRNICPSDLPYTWEGNSYTEPGNYYRLLSASNGCDSLVILHLTLNPVYDTSETREVCPAAMPYNWNNVTFNEAGTQTDTLTTINGCDSIVTMTLIVNDAFAVTDTRNVCPNVLPYNWNSVTFTEAGTLYDTLTAINGCDSVVTMILIVNNIDSIEFAETACNSFTWNEVTYTESGNYTQTFTNAANCDSVVTLHLTVNYSDSTEFAETVCNSFTWNEVTYTESGDYTQTFTNIDNCDSVVTLHLTVNYSDSTEFAETVCNSFTWNEVTYSESGDYTQTFTNIANCDSVVTLHLTVNYSDSTEFAETVCNSFTWNEVTYTESGDYTQTFTNTANCDSVVTLHLTVNYSDSTEFAETVCNSFTWNEVTYTESGDYTQTFTNTTNCDSVVTLHLTVNYSDSTEFAETVCNSFTWNEVTFTESGDYTQTFTNIDNCDSVVTLHLTVNYSDSTEFAETVCNSFTWNEVTYTESGDYTQTFTNIANCDSVVTLHLTVNYSDSTEFAETACNSFTWNEVTYTESGDYTQTFSNIANCDSVVTLHLTVNYSDSTEFAETVCNSFTWNEVTYTESGDYTQTFTNIASCDSVVTLHLTVNYSDSTEFAETVCNSFTWNEVTYSESGDYTQTFTNAANCDSVMTLHLTVNYSDSTEFAETVCNSFTWNDVTYTESGDYTQTFSNAANCDSIVTLHLTVNYSDSTEFAETVCNSFTWNEVTYTESGDYTQTFSNITNCDSVVTLHLTVNYSDSTEFAETVCNSFTWNEVTYTESGDYTQSFTNIVNCDSVVTLHLTVNYSDSTEFAETVCNSFTWNEVTYTESGDYTQTFSNITNCDSVVTLHLTVNYSDSTEFAETVCNSFTWNEVTYTESGDYTQSFTNTANCDSVVTLHLTVNYSDSTEFAETVCNSFTWNEVTYTESGDYTQSFTNAANCDSVVTLHLTVNYSDSTEFAETVCNSFTWNDVTYTENGDYTQTFSNIANCDSVVTLHLTVNYSNGTEFAETVCNSFTWNEVTYTESGDYMQTFTNIANCDSVVTMHLTVNYSDSIEFAETVCNSFTWNEVTYTESGDYTQTFSNVNNCDSVVTMHLTVNYSDSTEFAETVCNSFTWNEVTYTESGDYTQTFSNVNNCDSVVTMHLTINYSDSTEFAETVCNSFTWNEVTYTESGDYTQTFTNIASCDSVVTLHLTINYSDSTEFAETVCNSFTWNEVTYSESGDYTQTFTNAANCDSVVTLHLTVNYSDSTEFAETACNSFTWNEVTYTESGDYTQTFSNIANCDSVVTLHLTVNYSDSTEFAETVCNSFTWNEVTYTESGDYTQTLTNIANCDSVVTLHLTVNYSDSTEFAETVCNSFTWNEVIYTESGDYTQTFTNIANCDSVVTLHLTVNYSDSTEFTETACNSFTWNDVTYTESGDYMQTFSNVNNCDSVVTMHLTVNFAQFVEFAVETADSCYEWNGQIYCASGDYTQTLTSSTGCDSVVTLHLTTSVGLDEYEVTAVYIAPNPTKGICRIIGLETEPTSVDIYNMRGKLVMRGRDTELDVTMLPTGIYVVKIFTGDRILNLKLVKQ